MKEYPSISRNFRSFEAYVFDKLDGSNLRFEWSKKQGWNKFGTRHRLFDETDPMFAPAIPLFMESLSEPLTRLAKDSRWEKLIVFAEFCGPSSFAGYHDAVEPKTLTVFDINPYKQGIMGPRDFLKAVAPIVPTPKFFGVMNWTRGFVDRIWEGQLEGVTFEGVIGKAGTRHELIMAKAKSRVWIDKVKSKFSEEEAEKIINS